MEWRSEFCWPWLSFIRKYASGWTALNSACRVGYAVYQKVYLCTSDQSAETGGERPHKMKSPQTPFRTT
jgi:hypothetical protein